MNELMIVFKGGNYLYYKTHISNLKHALEDFRIRCEVNNINIDNMNIEKAVLRDANGKKISPQYKLVVRYSGGYNDVECYDSLEDANNTLLSLYNYTPSGYTEIVSKNNMRILMSKKANKPILMSYLDEDGLTLYNFPAHPVRHYKIVQLED